ncbi:MAG: NAD(P)-dependent oxidoreductase [Proteobacteria bacterium]|nr:NAD(P)-dependent oxidoreductase [Pseudomonadota bacterium]
MKPKILFLGEHHEPFFDRLRENYDVSVPPMARGAARDEAIDAAAPEAQAIITITPLAPSRDQLSRMPKLELLGYFGAGYQSMDIDAYAEKSVAGFYCPAANADSVAELALALALAAIRRIIPADRFVRDGSWGPIWGPPFVPTLFGKTVGIIGLGQAGTRIASRCVAMGTTVLYHKPNPTPDVDYAYYDDLTAMAAASDVLIVACPGGEATRHIVNAEVLSALGPKGYLINIGRGTVVDTDALIAALENQTIAGAGLDVYEGEPGAPEALQKLDNVVLSPHRAGDTQESVRALGDMTIRNLEAYFSGKALITPIPELT